MKIDEIAEEKKIFCDICGKETRHVRYRMKGLVGDGFHCAGREHLPTAVCPDCKRRFRISHVVAAVARALGADAFCRKCSRERNRNFGRRPSEEGGKK